MLISLIVKSNECHNAENWTNTVTPAIIVMAMVPEKRPAIILELNVPYRGLLVRAFTNAANDMMFVEQTWQ